MNSGWKRKVSKAHSEGKSQEPAVDSVYSAVSSRGVEIEGQKYGMDIHLREVLCCGAVIISDGLEISHLLLCLSVRVPKEMR